MDYNLTDIRQYLEKRPKAEECLALDDVQLNKYAYLSNLLLNTYFEVEDLDSVKYVPIISQQTFFVFKNDIDLDTFYEYAGLNSGQAGVNFAQDGFSKGDLFSRIAKAILSANGIAERISDPDSKVISSFTWN